MRTDLEKPKGNGWEQSSNFVRQQSAEEVIKRRSTNNSSRKKTDRNRTSQSKADRDRMFLIVGIVAVVLVIILIFTAGKSWQRRTDKKEIELLSQSNAELQTKVQDLEKSNAELQNTVASIEKEPESSADSTGSAGGTDHVLQTAYNFREEPNVDSDVLAELDEGTTVKIIKMQDADWAQVEYNGQTGYIKCGDEMTDSGSTGASQSGANSEGNSEGNSESSEQDSGDSEEE